MFYSNHLNYLFHKKYLYKSVVLKLKCIRVRQVIEKDRLASYKAIRRCRGNGKLKGTPI